MNKTQANTAKKKLLNMLFNVGIDRSDLVTVYVRRRQHPYSKESEIVYGLLCSVYALEGSTKAGYKIDDTNKVLRYKRLKYALEDMTKKIKRAIDIWGY